MDETKMTGALPNMNVEITHRMAPDGSAEQLTIHLVATPNFQSALPLAGTLLPLPFMLGAAQSPWAAWTQAVQALMAPWASLAQSNPWAALLTDGILGKGKK